MIEPCVVCQLLGEAPMPGTSLVSLDTSVPGLVARGGAPDDRGAIIAGLCPEHVVDVYRERIEGVRMAWRILAAPAPASR